MFKNKLNIVALCHLVLSIVAIVLDFFINNKVTAWFLVLLIVFYGAFLIYNKCVDRKMNTVFYIFNIIPLIYSFFMCDGWSFVNDVNSSLLFAAIGLIYGLVYVLLFRKKYKGPECFSHSKPKVILIWQIALVLFSGIFIFGFLNFANTYLDNSIEQSVSATVTNLDGYDTGRGFEREYNFSMNVDTKEGQLNNIPLTYNEIKTLKAGDKVIVKVKNGFLGQPYCYYNNYTYKTFHRIVGIIFQENEMDEYIESLDE